MLYNFGFEHLINPRICKIITIFITSIKWQNIWKLSLVNIYLFFSLRYLENETDLPITPPDSNMLLSSNLITSKTLLQLSSSKSTVKHQRSNSLSEINEKIFNIPLKDPLHKVRLPFLDQCRPLQKRKIFKNISLDNRKLQTSLIF